MLREKLFTWWDLRTEYFPNSDGASLISVELQKILWFKAIAVYFSMTKIS